MGSGTILHVNAVGLMAAIEEGLDPVLRGRPFVVANEGSARAVVLDVSHLAHREGLRRGMPLALVCNLVPGLAVRPPRAELYRGAEERLWRIALEYTPLVERAGPGHLFIDLSGTTRLYGAPEDATQRFRSRVLSETGLMPALALSSTKTASKVATRVFRPGGFIALSSGEENLLVRRQPASLLHRGHRRHSRPQRAGSPRDRATGAGTGGACPLHRRLAGQSGAARPPFSLR